MAKAKLKAVAVAVAIKLDLGCGKAKQAGWHGIDRRKFDGVDTVCDLGTERWPFEDGSIEEAKASHFVEHLDATERIHFVNELYRVLRPGAKCTVVTPHWCSNRAYGDLTHKWPPVSEMWFYYLNREWREQNAPHNDFYTCDFDCGWGYSLRPDLLVRNEEYRLAALQNWKEAAQDMICTMTKPEKPR